MKEKIKIVQYGTGKMSLYTMKYAIEKGCEIVGAVDSNESLIGKDISTVLGGKDIGVKITSVKDAEAMMKKTKPDVCLVTTMSLLTDIEDALMICAKLGINAITTCEEALFSWNSNPVLTEKINNLAEDNNCTITGSGYQDVFWGNLIANLAGATHKIIKIKGSSSYNVEDYGIALAQAHGAGLSLEEFDKQIASADNVSEDERLKTIMEGKFLPSYMWNVNGWLADCLGLNVIAQTQKCIPQVSDTDINSSTLNMTIPKGHATGMSAVVTTETEEGIIIESECIGKVYSESEFDKNEWTIEGEPETTMIINRPNTVELTCATVVNRIPDVINAVPGFIPTCEMDPLKHCTGNLSDYTY